MKKIVLSMLAIGIAASSVMANGSHPLKKVKQGTCTSCANGQKCTKVRCTQPGCCK